MTGSRDRGELKGLLLGSVGPGAAARAHCPAIVVCGDKAGLEGVRERSLLGAGAPSAGVEAARFAFPEAEARKCTLDVGRAWRRPSDETTHDPLLAGEPEGRQSSGHRNCSTPCSASADLVVVGVRRRHGHFGLRLGRAGHTLLHHAECPVAIVPRSE